jgi:hypothetical protein
MAAALDAMATARHILAAHGIAEALFDCSGDDIVWRYSYHVGVVAMKVAPKNPKTACALIEHLFRQSWAPFDVQYSNIGDRDYWDALLRHTAHVRRLRGRDIDLWAEIEAAAEPVTSWGNLEAHRYGLACAR